ncbi:MAG: hypothetical protein NTZ12_09640, partial [Candidatus Aminicenantes bacterium]|nr:hypothetical protein [Candidatus Aminicenantes bacterium]
LEKIILQALQKKVEKRFQSAGEMIAELKKIQGELGKTGQPDFSAVPHTQILDAPVVKRRSFLRSPLKVIAMLIVLMGLGISWIFLSGKFIRHGAGAEKTPGNENAGMTQGVEAENPLTAPAANLAEKKEPPADTQKAARDEVKAETPENAPDKAAEKPLEKTPDKAPENKPAADEKNQLNAVPAATGADKKESPEKVQTKEAAEPKEGGLPVQQQTAPVEPLGSLDAELIRLRGFLAKKNLIAADRLADALLQSGNESRILPLLGNVKFFLNKFTAAEQLWLRSLQANHLVTLELVHLHDDAGDSCSGQLKFKKKIIMFSSNTRGDHSFALQAGNITSLSMADGLRITIAATINGQEMNESFMLDAKNNKLAKEQFLVDFLNKYVL